MNAYTRDNLIPNQDFSIHAIYALDACAMCTYAYVLGCILSSRFIIIVISKGATFSYANNIEFHYLKKHFNSVQINVSALIKL